VRVQARTFERLVTGQLRETVGAAPGEDPIDHYLGVLADKTGSLVATSARFGAAFAGVESSVVTALTAFGEDFGVAFQLSDDLIDIVSEGGASGKSPGTDLREGIATLPVLFALGGDDPAEARLRELVAGPVVEDLEHAEALALLRRSESLARATAVLEEYADRARGRLDAVPDGPVREALSALCTYVVTRSS
jgi:heptaprenyl diphosphate synthase